jgi:hypothetical protein
MHRSWTEHQYAPAKKHIRAESVFFMHLSWTLSPNLGRNKNIWLYFTTQNGVCAEQKLNRAQICAETNIGLCLTTPKRRRRRKKLDWTLTEHKFDWTRTEQVSDSEKKNINLFFSPSESCFHSATLIPDLFKLILRISCRSWHFQLTCH